MSTLGNRYYLTDPLPSLEKAYGMVIQVEDQLMLQNERVEVEPRMATQFGKQPPPRVSTPSYNNQGGFKRRLTKEERRRLKWTLPGKWARST